MYLYKLYIIYLYKIYIMYVHIMYTMYKCNLRLLKCFLVFSNIPHLILCMFRWSKFAIQFCSEDWDIKESPRVSRGEIEHIRLSELREKIGNKYPNFTTHCVMHEYTEIYFPAQVA